MRDIDRSPARRATGMSQFGLPLAWLVPGDYQIELLGANANGAVKERITIRVTG